MSSHCPCASVKAEEPLGWCDSCFEERKHSVGCLRCNLGLKGDESQSRWSSLCLSRGSGSIDRGDKKGATDMKLTYEQAAKLSTILSDAVTICKRHPFDYLEILPNGAFQLFFNLPSAASSHPKAVHARKAKPPTEAPIVAVYQERVPVSEEVTTVGSGEPAHGEPVEPPSAAAGPQGGGMIQHVVAVPSGGASTTVASRTEHKHGKGCRFQSTEYNCNGTVEEGPYRNGWLNARIDGLEGWTRLRTTQVTWLCQKERV